MRTNDVHQKCFLEDMPLVEGILEGQEQLRFLVRESGGKGVREVYGEEYDIFIMLMESSFERQIGESPWIPY